MMMYTAGLGCALLLLILPFGEAQTRYCSNGGCPSGQKCVTQRVPCYAPPCNSLRVCVDDPCQNCNGLCTSEDTCDTPCRLQFDCVMPPPATCAATLCAVGNVCVEDPTGARCVPTCQLRFCPHPQRCIDTPTGSMCVL
ncbi:uncharacterized protein LOC106167350 [Lingula anatina]|uniref:Uncharacterized protein LOC106167350 n=1 Tax=Lingula anatina TaxID=7574 RepID=A0A1S3ITN2_LINAN|nr:uncharacterized protein LOC106167350 [Lingula anatina]|eukprot:XP_013401557.1 uncharacterized protein LOC106167350 [Lingula anatina]